MDPGEHLALSGPLVMMGEAGVAFLTVQPGVGTIFRINQEYRESLNWCHMVSSVKKIIKKTCFKMGSAPDCFIHHTYKCKMLQIFVCFQLIFFLQGDRKISQCLKEYMDKE